MKALSEQLQSADIGRRTSDDYVALSSRHSARAAARVQLEIFAAIEMALLIEMIVRMNGPPRISEDFPSAETAALPVRVV